MRQHESQEEEKLAAKCCSKRLWQVMRAFVNRDKVQRRKRKFLGGWTSVSVTGVYSTDGLHQYIHESDLVLLSFLSSVVSSYIHAALFPPGEPGGGRGTWLAPLEHTHFFLIILHWKTSDWVSDVGKVTLLALDSPLVLDKTWRESHDKTEG